MKPIRLLNLGPIPSGQTQAIYHVLAERMDVNALDTIVICRPLEPYLCLGYHQVFETIFEPEECDKRGLKVYRRQIGGGATYLDENQIFYQCIFHHDHLPAMVKDMYAFTLASPVMTLRHMGLEAELRDTNEIEVNGKRIAGTGGGLIGEAAVVVGNLLLDFDYEAMAAVWRVPTATFRTLAQKALRECIVTLKDLSLEIPVDELSHALIKSFGEATGRVLEPGFLCEDEIRAIQEKVIELSAVEYLDLHKTSVSPEPMRTLKISSRSSIRFDEEQINGFEIRGSFWITENMIREAILESTPSRHWDMAEDSLHGTPFHEWKERLGQTEPGTL